MIIRGRGDGYLPARGPIGGRFRENIRGQHRDMQNARKAECHALSQSRPTRPLATSNSNEGLEVWRSSRISCISWPQGSY
ncbi:hypothetical protein CPB86DRAFT_780085 [Serendipita vermifera]|nr:hypothetical protein CPB86DRAFT_780085 [Serendipita vermifera]